MDFPIKLQKRTFLVGEIEFRERKNPHVEGLPMATKNMRMGFSKERINEIARRYSRREKQGDTGKG